MIEVSREAREKIRSLAGLEKNNSPIRIMPAGGCTACRLGMLFDAARANDEIFEIEGIRYVIDRDLLQRLQAVTIRYTDGAGFQISSCRELDGIW